MKNWKIDYSILYKNGEVEERDATIQAINITVAMAAAIVNIVEVLNKDPKVMETVIWGVTIIDDDPF